MPSFLQRKKILRMVALLGVGAVGTLMAAHLRTTPQLILRHGRVARGVVCTGLTRKERVVSVQSGVIERLMVTTKSYQAVEAVESIAPYLTPNSTVLLMMNGAPRVLEHLQHIKARFLLGTNTHGCILKAPFHVEHTGVGEVWVGPASAAHSDDPWLHDLQHDLATLQVHVEPDATRMVQRTEAKVVANACINPLATLLRVPNGELLQHPALMDALIQEAAQATHMNAQYLKEYIRIICHDTAHNTNSMWIDVQQGRRTEIDWINGWIVDRAKETHSSAPLHAFLCELIRAMHP
jgi:2-dehydropantoate 2-reductase